MILFYFIFEFFLLISKACISANRIYVQSGIFDEFVTELEKEVKKLKMGDGFDSGVSLGPLINKRQQEKVLFTIFIQFNATYYFVFI